MGSANRVNYIHFGDSFSKILHVQKTTLFFHTTGEIIDPRSLIFLSGQMTFFSPFVEVVEEDYATELFHGVNCLRHIYKLIEQIVSVLSLFDTLEIKGRERTPRMCRCGMHYKLT